LAADYRDLGYMDQDRTCGFAPLSAFGHEGRIPPLATDNRIDPQYPLDLIVGSPGYGSLRNIGDDANGVVRLRRTFDTWSTDYTNAPAIPASPMSSPMSGPPFNNPVYPSYPAPYPQALRGIQIQIRVVDPKNEKIKTLTIRHDFTDKL
ncbi:MAG: hypothetical protein ABI353_19820, partial [Isosphaeraceae bacterium]